MSRTAIAFAVVLLGVGVVAATGRAQLKSLIGPEKQHFIYDGDLELDSGGIEVTSWGSGRADSVYEETYVGPEVLKVTSHGSRQGIVLHLQRPASLEEFLTSDAAYLDLRVLPGQPPLEVRKAEEIQEREALRGAGGRTRGAPAGRTGGGARGGAMGGARGGPMGGARGGAMGGQQRTPRPGGERGAAEQNAFTARHLRVVLFTDAGMMIGESTPIGVLPKDDHGWLPVVLALSQLKGAEGAATVRAVGVFADQAEVFYLGRVSLLVDRRPVEVTVNAEPLFTRTNRIVEFTASLRGGAIHPEFSWDFDDRDGIQKQALGDSVKYMFKEPGNYLVTCTATDRSGARSPIAETVGIRVEGTE